MSEIGMVAKGFVRKLEKEHNHYTADKLRDVYDHITIMFKGEQIPAITVHFIFVEDNEETPFTEVQIRIVDFVPKVKESRKDLTLEKINELNREYSFGKFIITEDNGLEFRIDALADSYCSGIFCYELMYKALKICDESYLRLAVM